MFENLRKEYDEYEEAYLNYATVRDDASLAPCFEILLSQQTKYIAQYPYDLIKQTVSPCFGRRSVLPLKYHITEKKFSKDILIHPLSANEIMIFKYNKSENKYHLLDWFDEP